MKAECMTDFLTFSLLEIEDPKEAITNILGLSPELFQDSFKRLQGYEKALEFENILVGYEPYMNTFAKGVCISMSGQGCRAFERSGKDRFPALFELIHSTPGINATRFDLACDFKGEDITFEPFLDAFFGEFATGIRSHARKKSLTLSKDGQYDSGSTLYIGSHKKSEMYIRVYDKAKEMYGPENPEYYQPWIRVEIVFRRKYAENAIAEVLNHGDLGTCAAKLLNGFMQFISLDDSNISRCSVAAWWAEMLESLESVTVWAKGEIVHTIERKLQYLRDCFAPTVAMLCKALGVADFDHFINCLVRDGVPRMSERQRCLAIEYKTKF